MGEKKKSEEDILELGYWSRGVGFVREKLVVCQLERIYID